MIENLPQMLVGEDLKKALSVFPDYDDSIRFSSTAQRLSELNEIYNIYYPTPMSEEIYSKLYLAHLRAIQKKKSILVTKQQYENRKAICSQPYQGIIGGSDSFTIIGVSGIGKSTTISRCISLISQENLTINNARVISFLVVQTPHNCSVKSLLLEILRKVDETLGTNYYNDALRARATLDMLIGSVSQICLNHICVLVLDEVQNVVNSKGGNSLINSIVQLINNSGISICFVGVPECTEFFETNFQLARRSVGLYYSSLPFDEYFFNLYKTVFSYQYTKYKTEFSYEYAQWLHSHSAGITAVAIGLIYDAQEIAILSGNERLSLDTLMQAYTQRMRTLHGFISPQNKPLTSPNNTAQKPLEISTTSDNFESKYIAKLVLEAKNNQLDTLSHLRQFISIDVVPI